VEKLTGFRVSETRPSIRNKLARGKIQTSNHGAMPTRDRRPISEAERVIVSAAAIAVALAVVVSVSNLSSSLRTGEPNQASQSQGTKEDWQPHYGPADNYAPYQDANCQKPKGREEADLCQQWRMAKAAERSLVISWVQLWFGFFGIVGLIATVIYSAIAASAARRSAEISAQAFINTERAWITTKLEQVGDLRLSGDKEHFGLLIGFRNTNVGKTPAINVHSNVRLLDLHGVRDQIAAIDETISELKKENTTPPGVSTRMLAPQDNYLREWGPGLDVRNKLARHVFINIIICVSYNVLHDDKLRHTVSVYILDRRNGGIRPIDSLVRKEDLEFQVTGGGQAT
jgi:hypothetical protein